MKLYDQPPTTVNRFDRSSDDLDHVLHEFFQAEMPDPWPSLEFPSVLQTRKPVRRSKPLHQSRFALAASVLFLLLGSLWVSGMCKEWNLGKGANVLGTEGSEATQRNPYWEPESGPAK